MQLCIILVRPTIMIRDKLRVLAVLLQGVLLTYSSLRDAVFPWLQSHGINWKRSGLERIPFIHVNGGRYENLCNRLRSVKQSSIKTRH